ncbi:MAG: hypothetical protein EOP02_04330 [Proteobacteria bacterium]|nr:MAG: hypothetical protein EOP02_04330 [Pseudomonadota bacterium]
MVAAELAFARMARERGQWTAFAQYAAPDALMFVPAPVNAQTWLKGRANPAQAVKWQPHQVWSSCDGSLAVAKGAWQQGDGTSGYFTTIWQRQEDGSLKWVLDQGDALDQPLGEPEMVSGQVADCDPVTSNVITMPRGQNSDGRFYFDGHAKEDSLSWTITVEPDLSRVLRVYMWQDKEMREVLTSSVAAPAK